MEFWEYLVNNKVKKEPIKVVLVPSSRNFFEEWNKINENQSKKREAVSGLNEKITLKLLTNGKKGYFLSAERAKLLYETITATDNNGNYLYHNILLSGGNGTEDTIYYLKKYLRDNSLTLPNRAKDLNVFGFSDASQLLHYLGQRGIATPIYYSALNDLDNLKQGIIETVEKQKKGKTFPVDLKVVHIQANERNFIGHTQPGSITSIENRPTHQLRAFDKDYNMLIVELNSEVQIKRLSEIVKKMQSSKKEICLVLSKDTKLNLMPMIKSEFPDVPIFYGAPMGHKDCLVDGKPIPLFASCEISVQNDGTARMQIEPFSDLTNKEKVENLWQANPERKPLIAVNKNATTEIIYERTDGAGRPILSDMCEIEQGADEYTINIKATDVVEVARQYKIANINEAVEFVKKVDLDAAWQEMDMCIKELLEQGIINPDNLRKLNFKDKDTYNATMLKNLDLLRETCDTYLPNIEVTYNGVQIYPQGNQNNKIYTAIKNLKQPQND